MRLTGLEPIFNATLANMRRGTIPLVLLTFWLVSGDTPRALGTEGSGPPQLIDGLVAHWPLNEGSGVTALDTSGAYGATLMDGATWTTGHLGSAVRLDGSAAYMAPSPLDVYGSALTLAAWVNVGNYPANAEQRIISKATGTAEQEHYWMLSQARSGKRNVLRFRLKAGGSTTTVTAATGDLPTKTWYHAAATYDGGTMRLYLDGVEVGNAPKAGAIDTNAVAPVNIGRSPEGSNYLRGTIDDVRVYNRALTTGEITEVMNGTEEPTRDTTAPSVPTGVRIAAVLSTEIRVEWTASTDDTGVAGYRVRRSSLAAAVTSATTYTDAALTPSTPYSYTVSAFDAAGNESGESGAVSATTVNPDTTAPSISAVAANGVTGSAATIIWATNEPATSLVDYGATISYGLSASDGGLVASHSLQLSALQPATTYHYRVTSADAAGNVTRSLDLTFTTNRPPTVALTSPAAGATFTAPATITLAASASDPENRLASVQFFSGASLLATDSSAPYSFTWSSVAAGSYSLTAVARDADGAVATSAAVTMLVKAPNQPPSVLISAPTTTSFSAPASILVSAVASDPEGRLTDVQFYAGTTLLMRTTAPPYTFTWSLVPAGVYTLTAVASDADGGQTTSAPVQVTVTTTAPVTPWRVAFTASSDHDTLLTSYRMEIFTNAVDPTVAAPLVTNDLGKPTPDANREIVVDRTSVFEGLAPGTYLLTVQAAGASGATRSASFTFTR
ncbi:MAG: LamG-like jellyroll fold domain-containing protein [Vicinamibacterales bacterium]